MARDPGIETRLVRWAEWVKVGDGSGYATVSPLHESWTPPVAGQRPTLKVAPPSDVRDTHRAVRRLPIKLRNAVVVHYVYRGTVAEQAARMQCEPATVHARIVRAHQALLGSFCNIEEVG